MDIYIILWIKIEYYYTFFFSESSIFVHWDSNFIVEKSGARCLDQMIKTNIINNNTY